MSSLKKARAVLESLRSSFLAEFVRFSLGGSGVMYSAVSFLYYLCVRAGEGGGGGEGKNGADGNIHVINALLPAFTLSGVVGDSSSVVVFGEGMETLLRVKAAALRGSLEETLFGGAV
jgi:hypothetical protein